MDIITFILNNALALILGAMIGFERQWKQRNAGLRTNALVTLGSSLYVSLSFINSAAPVDPTRIAAQVVSGVGFLGAGLLMREGLNVRGLNTAATLWSAAAIGILSGSGMRMHAMVGTCFILLLHLVLRPIGAMLNRQPHLEAIDEESHYQLEVVSQSEGERQVRSLLVDQIDHDQMHLQSIESESIHGTGKVTIRAFILTKGKLIDEVEKVVGHMSIEPFVSAARWKTLPRQLEE